MAAISETSDRPGLRSEEVAAVGFTVFRSTDAIDMRESGALSYANLNETMLATLGRIQEAGGDEGSETEHLFAAGGMSLSRVWFKSGFPLLLHSHDTDCLYYITAGSLRLGTKSLGVGDGFFVPTNVPYAYTAGDEGVELLEFRSSETYDFRMISGSARYYDRIISALASRKAAWRDEVRPT